MEEKSIKDFKIWVEEESTRLNEMSWDTIKTEYYKYFCLIESYKKALEVFTVGEDNLLCKYSVKEPFLHTEEKTFATHGFNTPYWSNNQ
jgi:hypothetical protein